MRRNKAGVNDVYYEQEPRFKIVFDVLKQMDTLNMDALDLMFSNFFQLLPIWVMMLIQCVSDYQFKNIEYVSNLMIFVVVSCATILSDLFKQANEKKHEQPQTLAICILISILCFSSVLYCLLLLYGIEVLRIKIYTIWIFSLLFIFFILIFRIWQDAKKRGQNA